MTDQQIFDATTGEGTEELHRLFSICNQVAPWCLIGGLALNTHLQEPRFTRDADIVFTPDKIDELCHQFTAAGFRVEHHTHSVNVHGTSRVFFQISTDPAYAEFPKRSIDKTLWGIPVKSACLEDLITSKVMASREPARRPSKRIQDVADLERIREEFPSLSNLIPAIHPASPQSSANHPGWPATDNSPS